MNKKLSIYEETMENAEKSFKYSRWGELITANLYRITPGMTEITVEDYNEETLPQITIQLDPQLSGIDNSQRYYRLYNKAKVTLQKTEPLKAASLNEVNYLESVLLSLEQASTPSEIEEVHKELIDQEYLAGKHINKSNPKKASKYPNKANAKKNKEISRKPLNLRPIFRAKVG